MSDENTITNPSSDENTLPGAGARRPVNASRRKFLKAALVGSAATVAVGAAAAVGLERAGAVPAPLARFPILGASGSPGGQTGTACTTGTDSSDYDEQSTFGKSEAIFLWALFTDLPAGNYHLSVSPTIETTAICSPTATNPFQYLGGGSAVRIYTLNQPVSWTCSPDAQTQLPTPVYQKSTLDSTSIPVTVGQDLQLQIHMKNGCSGGRTVTETINLYQGSNTTPFLTASATITITA